MGTLYVEHVTEVLLRRSGVLTVANDRYKKKMPYDFEIIGFSGYIQTLGTGAGTSTDIQVRNETLTPDLDYFSTKPTFEVDTASNQLEGGELIDSPIGYAGDVLCLDVDAIPGGADSADVDVWLMVRFFIQATP